MKRTIGWIAAVWIGLCATSVFAKVPSALNSSILLLELSDTQKVPSGATAIPRGERILPAPVPFAIGSTLLSKIQV